MSTETVETKKQGKGAAAAKAIGAVALAGCLVASLGLNIYQAAQASAQNEKVNSFIDGQLERQAKEEEQENTYMEDGFVVGGDYEIRSTTHISDAYKNGDDSQLSEADKETLEMAKEVLDEVIEDGMDNYEKEHAVYKWMVENLGGNNNYGGVISRPGRSTRAFTPHDVLASRDAVCVGYATTFRLFMNMLGMDVHIVHNEYHSWDLIKLDDGWYHVDIYSDAHGTPFVYQTLGIGDVVGAPVPGTMTAVWWETQIDPTIYFGIPQVTSRAMDGTVLENHQLNPDVLIYNNPADVQQGIDAQLIGATRHLLDAIDR